MEIRCSNCQHVGPAADVVQSPDGILFVCENCGHENPVSLSGKADASAEDSEGEDSGVGAAAGRASAAEASATTSVGGGAVGGVAGDAQQQPGSTSGVKDEAKAANWFDDARARLIPEQGEGTRCPKCLSLIPYDVEMCPRCGLDVERARRFGPGEAPWEKAPAGREAAWEQAQLLWASTVEDPSDENFEKFVTFTKDEQLAELGVRRLREYLAHNPDDERVIPWLEEIAATFQARIMVARAQAEMSAEKFSESTQKVKTVLVVIAALYLTVLLIIAAAWFMG